MQSFPHRQRNSKISAFLPLAGERPAQCGHATSDVAGTRSSEGKMDLLAPVER